MWMDFDTNKIEVSRIIHVRMKSPFFTGYIRLAENLIKTEIEWRNQQNMD